MEHKTHNTRKEKLPTSVAPYFMFYDSSAPLVQKGFTLIEALVAVSILLVAIVGPLTIASQSLTTARAAKDNLVATFLAQEGVELVRALRDGNILSGNAWLYQLNTSSNCTGIAGCTIDSSTLSVTKCAGVCPLVGFDDTTGYYGYSSGITDTKYRRIIYITEISGNEITVTASVEWEGISVLKNVTIEDNLLNWQ